MPNIELHQDILPIHITNNSNNISSHISNHINLNEAFEYCNQEESLTTNFIKAMQFMVEQNAKIVSYEETINYHINNISILREYQDKYIYEIELNNNNIDLVKNFESNVEIKVSINDKICDIENLLLIPFLVHFSKIKILFLIDRDNPVENFYLKFNIYLLCSEKRRELAAQRHIQTDTHLYMEGFAGEI